MNTDTKNILISGGTTGIGRAIVEQLLTEGHKVATFSPEKDEDKALEEAHADLVESGQLLVLKGDVTKEKDVEKIVKKTIEAFGSIEVLINNAGLGYFTSVDMLDIDTFKKMIDVNVVGLTQLTAEVVPYMKKREGQELIINMSSIAGKHSSAESEFYAATKFAVQGLTEGLRKEVVPEDIKVTTVCPGIVNTELSQQREDVQQGLRPMLEPADIARVVSFIIQQPVHVDIQDITVVPFGRT